MWDGCGPTGQLSLVRPAGSQEVVTSGRVCPWEATKDWKSTTPPAATPAAIEEESVRHSSSGPSRDIGFPPPLEGQNAPSGLFQKTDTASIGINFPQLPPLTPGSATSLPPVSPFGYLQPIMANSAPA